MTTCRRYSKDREKQTIGELIKESADLYKEKFGFKPLKVLVKTTYKGSNELQGAGMHVDFDKNVPLGCCDFFIYQRTPRVLTLKRRPIL